MRMPILSFPQSKIKSKKIFTMSLCACVVRVQNIVKVSAINSRYSVFGSCPEWGLTWTFLLVMLRSRNCRDFWLSSISIVYLMLTGSCWFSILWNAVAESRFLNRAWLSSTYRRAYFLIHLSVGRIFDTLQHRKIRMANRTIMFFWLSVRNYKRLDKNTTTSIFLSCIMSICGTDSMILRFC